MNEDRVSVIIPIYNMEKYLDRCVQSVLHQTYTNLEILLVDDGSTDHSWQMMQQYAEQDARVRIFHKENGGVSSARNLGLEMMTGEYFTFVDPDDTIEYEMVQRMLKAIKYSGADIVFCGHRAIDSETGLVLGSTVLVSTETVVNKVQAIEFVIKGQSMPWGKFYKKSACEISKFDEQLYIGEDLDWLLRILRTREKICVIDDILYNYTQRQDSLMHTEYSKKRLTYYEANKKMLQEVQEYNNDRLMTIAYTQAYKINAGIMMDAYFAGDIQTYRYLDKDLKKSRTIWRKNRHAPFLILRYGVIEWMMRLHVSPKLVKFVRNFNV